VAEEWSGTGPRVSTGWPRSGQVLVLGPVLGDLGPVLGDQVLSHEWSGTVPSVQYWVTREWSGGIPDVWYLGVRCV